jgi:CDP-glycerol glycerophosphotransferase (TagB/SpsB family)
MPVILYYKLRSMAYPGKDKYRGAWLVCERGIEAQDNGYAFFRYLRERHPDQKVYYLIDFASPDYGRVQSLGSAICYNSYEHKMALFFAARLISTHGGYMMPWSYLLFRALFRRRGSVAYVMLNHGVVKDDESDVMNKRSTGFDLFMATTQPERAWLLAHPGYGFAEKEVPLVGAPRYDYLTGGAAKRQIAFLPTWRKYLIERDPEKKNSYRLVKGFESTPYFRAISGFLGSQRLHALLEGHGVQLIFRPHPEAQRMCPLLASLPSCIEVATSSSTQLMDLLQESAMLITDYSSVAFDFAYMKKPLVYYQFDQVEYRTKHYREGYFSFAADGFGEVVMDEAALLAAVETTVRGGFQMEELYQQRVDDTFAYRDTGSCERVYQAIEEMGV